MNVLEDNYIEPNKAIEVIKKTCERYSKKHNIKLSFCETSNVNIGSNEGTIIKSDRNWHFAGYYRINDEETGISYYIVFDTNPKWFPERFDIKKQLLEKNNNKCMFINIGTGLQSDGQSCMIFALKGTEILAKNKGKIAKEIVEYVKDKCKFRVIAPDYASGRYKDIYEVFFDIKKKPEEISSNNYNLADIDDAGEFIKLAQSYELQQQYKDLKCSILRDFSISKAKGLLKRKRKITVGEYLDEHKEFNSSSKKMQSNKINKLYDKIMLNHIKSNEKD